MAARLGFARVDPHDDPVRALTRDEGLTAVAAGERVQPGALPERPAGVSVVVHGRHSGMVSTGASNPASDGVDGTWAVVARL